MVERSALLPAAVDWDSWSAIFTATDLWREAVVAVCSRLGQPLDLTQIEPGYPGTCAVFIVDRSAVVKFFPPFLEADFEKERAVYRLIEGRPLRQPRLLAEGVLRDRLDWPYLVLQFCEGEAWRDVRVRLGDEAQRSIGEELGRLAQVLHDTPTAAVEAGWPPVAQWPGFVAERLPCLADELASQTALPDAARDEAVALLSQTEWFAAPPVLLHGDLTTDHLLLAETGGSWRVSALLDWADAEVGDPFYDWVAVWFDFCERDRSLFEAILRGYGNDRPVDPAFVRRLMANTLLHRFGARIIDWTLPVERQEAIGSVDELEAALFGPLLEGYDRLGAA